MKPFPSLSKTLNASLISSSLSTSRSLRAMSPMNWWSGGVRVFGKKRQMMGGTRTHHCRRASTDLCEVYGSVAVGVNLVDHVLELSLGGVLAEGAHDSAELLDGDGAIAVLVEEGEGLLELCAGWGGECEKTDKVSDRPAEGRPLCIYDCSPAICSEWASDREQRRCKETRDEGEVRGCP